jgi:hypothetical protein
MNEVPNSKPILTTCQKVIEILRSKQKIRIQCIKKPNPWQITYSAIKNLRSTRYWIAITAVHFKTEESSTFIRQAKHSCLGVL